MNCKTIQRANMG